MEIDSDGEQYLATGDVNGNVKVWNIENYCRNIHQREDKTIDTNPRNYFHNFQNKMKFNEQNFDILL